MPRTVGRLPRQAIRTRLADRAQVVLFVCRPRRSPARQSTCTAANLARAQAKLGVVPSRARSCTRRPRSAPSCAPLPAASRCNATVVPTGTLRSGRQLPDGSGAPAPDMRLVPNRHAARGDDVSGARRRRRHTARGARCGSGRTRDARPWRRSRPCCDGSRRCDTAACDHRPCAGMVMWPLLLRPEPRFWLSVSFSTGRPLVEVRIGPRLTSARRPADVGFDFLQGHLRTPPRS